VAVDKNGLDPTLYGGSLIYNNDNQLYYSNGSVWILVQPANVEFSFTGNNTLFMNGKQESQLSVNSAVYSTNATFSYTANNARFAYGKQESQLSVNLSNNSTYAYGKQETQLSVANAVYSQTANNSTHAYGKQEAQLSVANSVNSNNSTYAYGKQEAQLSVSAANNSNFLENRTWAAPSDIGTSVAANGIFTNVTVLDDLIVNGSLTYVNTSVTTTNNTFIILNDSQASPFNDIGVVFQRYTSPSASNYNVAFFWDEATKQVILGKASSVITQNTQNLSIASNLLSVNEAGTVTIDGQLIANQEIVKTLTINTLIANGSSGSARQFLTANGASGTYWHTLTPSLPLTNNNTLTTKLYLPMSEGATGDWTSAIVSDERISFVPSTGTLTSNQGAFQNIFISGNSNLSNIFANGSIGGLGQVLVSNGAGIYWENSLTIAPRAGFGLSSNNTHYQVNANTGIIATSQGTFVNAAYIATITSNNATYAFGKQESQLSVANSVFSQAALVSNNSSYLEGRIWASPASIGQTVANTGFFTNTVINVAQVGALNANGSIGVAGQVLASNGVGIYWTSNPPGISIPLVQNNTSTSVWYFPMANTISGSWSQGAVSDAGLSYVPDTGTMRIKTANVATAVIANAVITGIFANGTFGSVNSVLVSNGSSVYWSSDNTIRYDLIAVANTGPNRGIVRLTDTTQANDDVMFVGRGTTVVSSNASHVVFATQDQYVGTVTSITSGNGLVGAPITSNGTLAVGAGAGISVNVDDVAVNPKDGLVANSTGLWINNDYVRNLGAIATANNANYLNGKLEAELSVANAVFATTANNSLYAYGRQQSQLSVNNAIRLNGKQESQLYVANAVFATVAGSVLGSIETANNSTYAYGKQESQLYVANAVFATTALNLIGSIETANNSTYAYGRQQGQLSVNNAIYVNGKQESQLYVANAVFATVAGSVLGSISTANNATYAYGKQESQLVVSGATNATNSTNATNANNSTYAYGKQESQLRVANAVYAATAASAITADSATTAGSANNATYAFGKQEGQLNVLTSATSNNATYAYGKQETQLNVGFLNGQNGTYYSDIPSRLGFTPVRQGGGAGQGTDTIKIGWLGSQLGLEVGTTSYGATWPINVSGSSSSGTANNATYAYGKQEGQLSVASAATATTAGSTSTATNATNAANSALLNSQNSAFYRDASNLNAGTVPTARLASGTASTTTFLRGDSTWASIPNTTTWDNNITWNGGINVSIAAESSFDLSGSGVFGVNDGGSGYSIKSGVGAQVEIGAAGNRGLYVYGAITASDNITAYSDISIKKNIEVIPNALDKVSQIRGVTFERLDFENDKRYAGVIAQEVEAVLPEVVQEDAHGIKTVAYGNLVGLLIEAVKELKAEIEELKSNK
jgi:hypothetical protein